MRHHVSCVNRFVICQVSCKFRFGRFHHSKAEDGHFGDTGRFMLQPLIAEGWPALMSLECACRYLSLTPDQFLGLTAKAAVFGVEIGQAGEPPMWRRSDLDRLLKHLPLQKPAGGSQRKVPTVQLDATSLRALAMAVADELRKTQVVADPAKRDYLSVKEAAHRLCLSRSTIYRLISKGDLQVRHIGQRALISQDSIDRLLGCA